MATVLALIHRGIEIHVWMVQRGMTMYLIDFLHSKDTTRLNALFWPWEAKPRGNAPIHLFQLTWGGGGCPLVTVATNSPSFPNTNCRWENLCEVACIYFALHVVCVCVCVWAFVFLAWKKGISLCFNFPVTPKTVLTTQTHESYPTVSLWHCVLHLCLMIAAACSAQREQCKQVTDNLWPDAMPKLMSWLWEVEAFPSVGFPDLSSSIKPFFYLFPHSCLHWGPCSSFLSHCHHLRPITPRRVDCCQQRRLSPRQHSRYSSISVRELCPIKPQHQSKTNPLWFFMCFIILVSS